MSLTGCFAPKKNRLFSPSVAVKFDNTNILAYYSIFNYTQPKYVNPGKSVTMSLKIHIYVCLINVVS